MLKEVYNITLSRIAAKDAKDNFSTPSKDNVVNSISLAMVVDILSAMPVPTTTD